MKGFALACALLLTASGWSCGSTASTPTSRPEPATLYERLGGVETLRVLVDEWIVQVGSDPRIRDYFVDSDVAILKLRLVERVCVLVEGPCVYKGRDLYEAHAHLKIEDRHLTAFLDGLEPAIARAGIAAEPAQELRELLRGLAAELAIAVGSDSL